MRQERGQGKTRYQGIHYGAAGIILLAILLVVAHKLWGPWPSYGVLVAEVIAVYAFAISWFAKGWEFFDGRPRDDAAGARSTVPESAPDQRPVLARQMES